MDKFIEDKDKEEDERAGQTPAVTGDFPVRLHPHRTDPGQILLDSYLQNLIVVVIRFYFLPEAPCNQKSPQQKKINKIFIPRTTKLIRPNFRKVEKNTRRTHKQNRTAQLKKRSKRKRI